MIIFILVHKNYRQSCKILSSSINNSKVKKIYLLFSEETIISKKISFMEKKNKDKIIIFKHKKIGIKGAWLQSMKLALEENSNFIIFENDIVPSNFFFEFSEKCFLFYKNDENFFGFTGYAPKENSKIKNPNFIETYFSYRSCSWSFASTPRIVKKFFNFVEKFSPNEIGEILSENKSKIGKDIYDHYLIDQTTNKHLIGYIWIAFMVKNNGLFVFPSEHLVSFYGNDIHALNHPDDGKSIISECDEKFSKATIINFRSLKKYDIKDNNSIVNYWNPTILQKIIRKLVILYKKI